MSGRAVAILERELDAAAERCTVLAQHVNECRELPASGRDVRALESALYAAWELCDELAKAVQLLRRGRVA